MSDALDALIQLAKDAMAKNEPTLARAFYTEAADLARVAGDKARLGYVLRHLSDIVRADNATEALLHAEEAQRLYRAQPDNLGLANSIRLSALAHTALAQTSNALASWREAGALYAQAGIAEGVAECEQRARALMGQS